MISGLTIPSLNKAYPATPSAATQTAPHPPFPENCRMSVEMSTFCTTIIAISPYVENGFPERKLYASVQRNAVVSRRYERNERPLDDCNERSFINCGTLMIVESVTMPRPIVLEIAY